MSVDAVFEELERRGVLRRVRDKNGGPTWRLGKNFKASKDLVVRAIAGVDKCVLEVRNGVFLYMNAPATEREHDGWWWTLDEMPLMYGPFESAEAAVKDASTVADKPIKVIEHDGMEMLDLIHTDGFVTVNIVNTSGHIFLTCPHEKPAVKITRTLH